MFDTTSGFGWVTILLHWITAITVAGLFVLGWIMVDLTYYDSLYYKLPFIHKSVGILLGAVLLLKMFWKRFNTTASLASHGRLEIIGARLAHWVLILAMIIIVISGYLISTADGSGISVFDWFMVPATITTIPGQEDLAGEVHKIMAYGMALMVLIHAIAALKHHFIDKDDTLRRMLGMKPQGTSS